MATRRKKAANGQSSGVESKLDALVADLEALQNDVRNLAQGVGDEANERVMSALRMAEERVASAVRTAEDVAEDAFDQAGVWAEENLDTLRVRVREQPVAACLIAMGAGALFGALFLRR
ncbi:MAG: hypothetical protein WBQ17_13150 [Rhizomicrobium sp.]|jgi:ElaB/YqjD/DUF883 family membrane-anchored ribosome-binding protein